MLIGWWVVFSVLAFFAMVTRSLAPPLALLVWVGVPPLTSLMLLFEARSPNVSF